MPSSSPCCVMRPVSTAATCRACPTFWGSSWLFLKRKTVLRAMTFMPGRRESALIRLSVNPSLRYSLFASAVAFTKGRTAIEDTWLAPDFGRIQYAPAAITTTTAARPAQRGQRELFAGANVAEEIAPEVWETSAAEDLPESRSRFRRDKSARRSAAFW